jgi:hypothetical protein
MSDRYRDYELSSEEVRILRQMMEDYKLANRETDVSNRPNTDAYDEARWHEHFKAKDAKV